VKPESKLYKTLRQKNPEPILERIENTLANGTPDLYFLANGESGWAELKVSLSASRLRLRYPPHQRIWTRRHVEAGGLSLLIVKMGDEVLWYRDRGAWAPEDSEPFHLGWVWPVM
jgi:hypothetical protein